MRRSVLIGFLPAVVITLVALAIGLFSGASYAPGPRGPLVYYVVAAGAPGWMRTGGPNRYLCDGNAVTGGDQVELRAAVAAASAAGGGIVEMVGTLYYSNPTAAEEKAWSGTGTVANPAGRAVITVTAWDGTFTMADVTVGEQLRLSLTGGGVDPATTNDDLVFTVYAKDATTITLHTTTQTATYSAPGVSFTRMVAAVEVPSSVTLRGHGHNRTRLQAIPAATCSAIQVTGALTELEKFDIRDTVDPVAYDHRRNGILVADGGLECVIRDVSVWYVKGSGFAFNEGHGVRVEGDSWAEMCRGRGYEANGVSELALLDIMPESNFGDGVVIATSSRVGVDGAYAVTSETGSYPIKLLNSYSCTISNCRLYLNDADPPGLLYIGGSLNATNTISNNTFSVFAANKTAVTIVSGAVSQVLTGNVFLLNGDNSVGINHGSYTCVISDNAFRLVGSGATAFTRGTAYGGNVVRNNVGAQFSDCVDCVRLTNRSGSDIAAYYWAQRPSTCTTDGDQIEIAAKAAIARCVGCLSIGGITDNSIGVVQTMGYCGLSAINAAEAAGQAVAIGDPLTLSATVPGTLVEAAATDTVLAVALEAQTGAGAVVNKGVLILPKWERFVAP